MNNAYLLRSYHPLYTTGVFVALDRYGNLLHSCVTLELPWRDNAPQISCIPEFSYTVDARESDKHGQHYHVTGVAGRTFILFHPGTYTSQLRGCIIPGRKLLDLNADQVPDITGTRATLDKMLVALGATFRLHIMSAPLDGGVLKEVVVRP